MATKKPGMTSSPLRRREDAEGAPRASSVVSALRIEQGDPSGIATVALADLAVNPDNPPERMQDVTVLAASVVQVGVIQALTIAPAAAFLAESPQHAEAVGSAPWVILAGHRRFAAATVAGLARVPVVVREDLAGDRAAEVILHENLHRKELTPIEEAQAFARVGRNGMSQQTIAAHTGVSQAQVSKRLSLLKLSTAMQDLVAAGTVPVVDALELTDLDHQMHDRIAALLTQNNLGIRQAVSAAEHELEDAARLQAAAEVAEQEGATVLADPEQAFQRAYEHELTTKKEIAAARTRGDLAVAPARRYGDPKPRFYRTSKPPKAERPFSEHETKEKEEAKQRKLAAAARFDALTRIVKTKPDARSIAQALTFAMLSGHCLGDAALARKLAEACGIGPDGQETDWGWRSAVAETTSHRDHLAWIIAVAARELAARNRYTQWVAADVEYLAWLASHGYVPTAWEQARIEAQGAALEACS